MSKLPCPTCNKPFTPFIFYKNGGLCTNCNKKFFVCKSTKWRPCRFLSDEDLKKCHTCDETPSRRRPLLNLDQWAHQYETKELTKLKKNDKNYLYYCDTCFQQAKSQYIQNLKAWLILQGQSIKTFELTLEELKLQTCEECQESLPKSYFEKGTNMCKTCFYD